MLKPVYSAARALLSLSARRAWIEITLQSEIFITEMVALRKESVDRNLDTRNNRHCRRVALRKESVDRNRGAFLTPLPFPVALRKESVDRNYIIKITETAPRRRSPQGERG